MLFLYYQLLSNGEYNFILLDSEYMKTIKNQNRIEKIIQTTCKQTTT